MKLEEYLRIILNNKLIPLVKKDQCEVCNSVENLEVHHIRLFKDILGETLQELKLEYKSKEEYSIEEINLIVNIVLGKHLNIEYMTLCENCHTLIHEDTWKDVCINNKHKQYYKKLKIIKNLQEKEHIKNVIIPYLNKIVGKRLYKEERQELINIINIYDSRRRQQKSISKINQYLLLNNINYIIVSKKSNLNRYWILNKTI